MYEFRKDYAGSKELLDEFESQLKLGGILVEHSGPISARQPARVHLAVAGRPAADLDAEVVYVSGAEGNVQVGLELRNDWQAVLEKVRASLAPAEDEKEKKWGKDSESLYHAIAKMDPHQKIQLALKGGREERRILLKDTHYMVHSFVLKNPKLASDEVAQIARMGSLTGEMIKTISDNAEWMGNPAVRLAIVKNPKTPANTVQKHIGQLKDNDLLLLAKSENVREAVSKMARRVLASRGRPIR